MYCILIGGQPASGKSRFAEYLSKEISIPMVSKDIIKEKMFDTVGFKCREEKVKLGVAAMDILYYFAEENMKVNKPFILENNFENSSREKLEEILKKYDYTPINVIFTGDTEVLHKRFLERDISPSRHRGHVVNTQYPEVNKEEYIPMTIEKYKSFKDRGMADFHIGDKIITVDTTDFNKVNYEEIVNDIRSLIK